MESFWAHLIGSVVLAGAGFGIGVWFGRRVYAKVVAVAKAEADALRAHRDDLLTKLRRK